MTAEILSLSGSRKTLDGDTTHPIRTKRKQRKPRIGFNYMADMEDRLGEPANLATALSNLLDDLSSKLGTKDPNCWTITVLAEMARSLSRHVNDCYEYAGMCALAASKEQP